MSEEQEKEKDIKEEVQNDKNKKDDQAQEEIVTIAPSMLDSEELDRENFKRDISAIIPQFETTKTSDQLKIESQENQLKSDGSIVIGNIVDDVYNYIPESKLPEMIDMKARKQFLKKNKDLKMNISEADINVERDKQKKILNITSTISLVIILSLVAFFFYYKSVPKESDFQALPVKVELGKSLPASKSAYIKPGIGKEVDELQYVVDTSSVIVDKVGEYPYTVRHNGVVKTGMIYIEDTTPPEIETREVVITQGESYEAASFVVKCSDLSGCNYDFEENNTESKYTEAGSYVVVVSATDAYGNKSIKQESLVIEQIGNVKFFIKEYDYDFTTDSQITEKYEIHFTDFLSSAIILTGVHTTTTVYGTEEAYKEALVQHYGEANYTCYDETKTIVHVEKAYTVGYNYSEYSKVMDWFETNGFKETNE